MTSNTNHAPRHSRRKVFVVAFLLLLCLSGRAQPSQPNVIFILTDDQGYGDLGRHGNTRLRTPHLDKLHDESVRFTNFHVGTTCAPTRAGLMTGRHSNAVGVWHTIKGRHILEAGTTTAADIFKRNGYQTALFGKWHLGDNYPFRPQDRGFEEVLYHKGGGIGQSPDYWNNDYFDDTYFHNGEAEPFDGYCTDVWFRQALKFIERGDSKPFFCYVSLNAPHSPYFVDPRYSAQYANDPKVPDASFYGMISNIDENIGMLLARLEELKLAENTIVVFMTDNGTAAGVRFGAQAEVVSGYNAGMRGTKGSVYDGGHRVPFFLRWPAGNVRTGTVGAITSYIDVLPTLLDLCGISEEVPQADGRSLVPLIRGNNGWPHRYLFVDTQRGEFLVKGKDACVMDDRWRLINTRGRVELYDMVADPGQRQDVAADHPRVVSVMTRAYEEWWSSIAPAGEMYNRIAIGVEAEPVTTLSSHDCHSEGGNPAWHQQMVRAGIYEDRGFWALDVAGAGAYKIELRRWPRESDLAIRAQAPPGIVIPGAEPYDAGKSLPYRQAIVSVGGKKFIEPVKHESANVVFTINLPKGPVDLFAGFTDDAGEYNNAYYVYVTRAR